MKAEQDSNQSAAAGSLQPDGSAWNCNICQHCVVQGRTITCSLADDPELAKGIDPDFAVECSDFTARKRKLVGHTGYGVAVYEYPPNDQAHPQPGERATN